MIVVGLTGRAEVRDRLAQEKIVDTPDSSIPGEEVDTGSEAKAFADTIRKHTLEATGGATYAEMPRAVFKDTNKPVPEDGADAALESGEATTTFTIIVGIALILIGIGLIVLTRGVTRTVPARP